MSRVAELSHHQVSYIRWSTLFQVDYMGNEADARTLHDGLKAHFGDTISDLQVYQPIVMAQTLSQTLRTIFEACAIEDCSGPAMHAELSRQAEAIDAAAQAGTSPDVQTIDFIWLNGGTGPNAFSQSFKACAGERRLHDFVDTLMEALDGVISSAAVSNEAERFMVADVETAVSDMGFTMREMGFEVSAPRLG